MLFLHNGADSDGQAEQADEAVGVLLVVDLVLIEGGEILVEQGIGRADASVEHVALVQLELHFAGDVLLGLFHEGGDGFPQRSVPLAEIDKLGVFQGHLLFVMLGLPIQANGLQYLMGAVEDAAAGSLVDAAGLHAHQTVLHQVGQADAIAAADEVQLFHQLHRAQGLAVDGNGHALGEFYGDVFRFVRRLRGRNGELQEAVLIVLRLVDRVFQIQTFMGQVPHVLVFGIIGLAGDLQRHVVSFGVVDLFVAGFDVPFPPGRDDLHIRGKTADGHLKTHLVVALAGAAVANGLGPFLAGDLHQLFGDQRTGQSGAQQIILFVGGVALHGGEDKIRDEFLFQVGYVKLGRSGLDGFFAQTVQLVFLAYVGGDGDDLRIVIVFLQPGDDDGRIQAAGISEDDFFDLFFFHSLQPP